MALVHQDVIHRSIKAFRPPSPLSEVAPTHSRAVVLGPVHHAVAVLELARGVSSLFTRFNMVTLNRKRCLKASMGG